MRYSFAKAFEGQAVVWEGEIDVTKLGPKALAYGIARGLKEALQDTFAGAKTAAEFTSGLDKKLALIISDDMPTFGQRAAGQPRDPLSEMIRRVGAEGLRAYAKVKGKKLPKVGSEDYNTLLAKFIESRKDKIEAEAKDRLTKADEIATDEEDDFDLPKVEAPAETEAKEAA